MKRFLCFALAPMLAAGALAQTQPSPTQKPTPQTQPAQQRRPFDLTEYGVRIEPDRRLIAVLASLEAAGLEAPLTEQGEEFRRKLRTDLAGFNPDLRQRMKIFVDQYAKRVLARQRAVLVNDKKSDDDIRRFDDNTKAFFDQLEKYRAGGMNEEQKDEFRRKNREFLTLIAAPFISMSYALGPAPDFNEPSRSIDLPDDLLEVLDFSPYVRQFYRSVIKVTDGPSDRATTVGARIDEYFKQYQAVGDSFRPSTARMVLELTDYLHTRPQIFYKEQVKTEIKTGKKQTQTLSRTEDRERERRFFVVPDLLAQDGTVNFRNVGDDYYAIVAPGTDLSASEVRRAYLQFVLDPIILKNSKEIVGFRDGIKALLDERRKVDPQISPDIFLAVSRSLVSAAEAREAYFARMRTATAVARAAADKGRKPLSETVDAQGRKVVKLTDELYLIDGRFAMPAAEDEMNLKLAEAYERGAVLAFYFAQQLKGLEDSEFDISNSLRDIILSLDTTKESARLAETAEARKRALAAREEAKKRAVAVLENSLFRKLEKIEPLIAAQQYAQAETALKELLAANPTEPRIFYSLGRVNALSAAVIKDPVARDEFVKKAKDFYTEALNNSTTTTDLALVSLTYVALGRLYEYTNQNAYAVAIYKKAMSYGDMPGGGYEEAAAAVERLAKEQ